MGIVRPCMHFHLASTLACLLGAIHRRIIMSGVLLCTCEVSDRGVWSQLVSGHRLWNQLRINTFSMCPCSGCIKLPVDYSYTVWHSRVSEPPKGTTKVATLLWAIFPYMLQALNHKVNTNLQLLYTVLLQCHGNSRNITGMSSSVYTKQLGDCRTLHVRVLN